MKILIDDVGKYVELYDDEGHLIKEIKKDSTYSFEPLIKELLSPSQYNIYTGVDTRRTFIISKKKAAILNNH